MVWASVGSHTSFSSQGLSDALAPGFEPTECPGALSLPVQSLHQCGTDYVVSVLDFHQEYDVTAFDDLQRENSQGCEAIYYK